jgi:hypothetical protein
VQISGAVLLGTADSAESHARKQLTTLIRVGGRLAVLGVEEGARAFGWWHVMQPGTFVAPQGDPGASDQEGRNLSHGQAMCGRVVVTNGYAADWRPPRGQLCPACAERI